MVYQQTGHALDILFTYEDHKPVIKALRSWRGGEVNIPLDNSAAEALADGIMLILKEAQAKEAF